MHRKYSRSVILFLCFLLCYGQALAALPAATAWDVRTTGANTNGGGYVVGSTGTDFSAQDTPHVTFNGSTITASNGAAGATITLVGYVVATTDVGNILQVAGGTNFITGFYQILSVNVGAVTWTLDRNVTSAAGAAMTGAMGGGFSTITQAQTATANGNTINIKAGTYTLTTGLTVPASDLSYIGYQTAHNDGGTKPLITTATNSINIFTDVCAGCTGIILNNLSLSSTAGTRGWGVTAISRNWPGLTILNSKLSGFSRGVYGDDGVDTFYIFGCSIINTEITGAATTAIQATCSVDGSFIHDNAGDGWTLSHAVSTVNGVTSVFTNTIFSANKNGINAAAIGNDGVIQCTNSIFYNNTADGIVAAGTFHSFEVNLVNNIFYLNAGFGLNISSGSAQMGPGLNQSNAYGNNTSGATSNSVPVGPGAVTLTANPFTNAAGGDFSLNNTAGGGAAIKTLGFPGAIGGSASTGFVDIGAIQTKASSGGGQKGFPIVQ